MTLRQIVFWTHLVVGLAGAVVVLMMSMTGVVLTFEAQLNRWAVRDYRTDAPRRAALDVEDLVARAEREVPSGRIVSVTVRADPLEPLMVSFAEAGTLYLDRYSGQALGTGDTTTRRVMRHVMSWHRWFGLEGPFRIVGRTFTATANLGFLFLVVSGVYLWWPARWTWAALRRAGWFRRGLAGRVRYFNWHSVVGLWAAIPLVIIIASGATMSYQWAGNLVYRVVGETPPSGPAGSAVEIAVADAGDADDERSTRSPRPAVPAQRVFERAAQTAGWQTITIGVPESGGPIRVTVDRGTGRQPSLQEDLLFDESGAVVGRSGYPTYSQGLKIRRWLRFAHTGEVYGIAGQAVAGAVSLGAAVLVLTGLVMSWHRFFGRGQID